MSTTALQPDLKEKKAGLEKQFNTLIQTKNQSQEGIGNGIYTRYKNPVLTAAHAPLEWRFDFNPNTNPLLLERIQINATFNACLLYTSPSPRDRQKSRMPSSA